ncbi:MAG: enoyl-CoA hydratase [Ponticaulis sp.]|nr:enoyl-CoA hydratase [Ponticaulis sp.]
MSDDLPVLTRKTGHVGRITLNRPKALHSLTEDMCLLMSDALQAWKDDPEVGMVIVDHTQGTRGFCAGGDIRMMAESGKTDGQGARDFFRAEYRLNALIHNFPKPYLAILDGVTMGGGVGISVHGSHRVTTENTVFAMPETGIGLFPDVGGGWFLPRLDGELGMWLALTGARLKGSAVSAIGVGTHHVPSEMIGHLVSQFEAADLSFEPERLIDTILRPLTQTVPPAEVETYSDVIDACFSKGSVEEIIRALNETSSDWALAQVKTMETKSPETLKIAFRQLREGAACETFEDNMRMEYRIGWRQACSPDFQEGVRAVIIDKDNKPDWPSKNLEKVSGGHLDEVFAPLGEDDLTFL